MPKHLHEIRDPVHVFIRLESEERRVLDSRPFQRLRHIHQLALTSLVYPGATHRRFEHSLGVMELAGRVYDVVTNPANIEHALVRAVVPATGSVEHLYWRRVLRMAALCHDIGHLPFSHTAEKELLPDGWDHERMTTALIHGSDLAPIWKSIKVQPDDVAKLAVGPKKYRDGHFSDLEAILAEIIVGDAFGVDRMDYLLRDSYHAGVGYGRFDHYRLIDTMRILPSVENQAALTRDEPDKEVSVDAPAEEETILTNANRAGEPRLGVAEGGLHSAEALLWARYFMYSQLYFHPIRRIYDIHLREFLKQRLHDGYFSTEPETHLQLTDNEIWTWISAAARDPQAAGHDSARRIVQHEHFRVFYERNPNDLDVNPDAAEAVYMAARQRYDGTNVHYDRYREKKRAIDFPVLTRDGRIASCLSLSETLKQVPVVAVDYVFVEPKLCKDALEWLRKDLSTIIAPELEEES